jgi:hypothetical protein
MELNKEKGQVFIARLLNNPAMQGLTPLQREEQVLQFLSKNGPQLYPTLASGNFFPGANWEQIWGLLTVVLYEEIDKTLLPALKSVIQDRIDLSFFSFFRQQNAPQAKIKEDLFTFLGKMLQRPESRRGFTGAFSALLFNFTEKYINQIFTRKEYIHFELIKVQRLRMGREEIKNMVHTSLLLRPVVFILSAGTASTGGDMSPGGLIQPQYAEKVVEVMQKNLPVVPPEVARSAVNSSVSFQENKTVGATARITALFSSRCRNYNPAVKVDRGADSPDKSWFSIARRNFKFYGFDVKMVDEFFKIAAENSW